MHLILTIEKGPQAETPGRTWRCGTEGGSLGRNPDCDLVLSDPKRYTSSVHARIDFGPDGFTLTDESTNGTYHNSPKTLIGKNRSVSLDQGDKLFIGDFVLRIDVEDGDQSPARPAPSATSQFDSDDAGAGFDSDTGSDFTDDAADGDTPASSADEDSRPWDNSDFSVPWGSEGTEPDADDAKDSSDADDDRSFSQSPEREYFAAPSASTGSGDAIPDDWDDFLTGFHDPSKFRKPDGDPGSAAESTPRSDDDVEPGPASDSESGAGRRDPADGGDKPFADAEPGEDERFDPPAAPTPRPEGKHETPSTSSDRAKAPESGAASGSSAPEEPPVEPPREAAPESSPKPAPKAASGPPADAPARGSQPGEARAAGPAGRASDDQVHEILQVVTEGLMGLLHGRAEIKNEFRIAQTRFVKTENNPLKFSPDADEALKRILGADESPGFLTGKRAFEDAFDDIQAHQLAILSAVQRAIESAVAQFDPAQIEKKLERISPMSARMPGLKAAKCWSLFSLHYEEMAEKMRDDARQLFLAEFAEAYEEACRAVAQRRRKDKS